MISHKIDFTMLITVKNANPNGDPLNGNRPRETSDGYGEISDVCIKRKIRNRLQDMGENIFVQSDDRCDDGYRSLHERMSNNENLKSANKGKKTDRKTFCEIACAEWIDVRSFGQLFAFKDNKKESDSVSIGIRGPVSIQHAVSVSPVDVVSMQIVKSVNGQTVENGGKSPDTMGTKHRVPFGLYVINGSINCQLAEKTGFSDEDAAKIKKALETLFENDVSSARPEGSMEVCRLYWWEHDCKTPQISSAKLHRSVKISLKKEIIKPKCFDDYEITLENTGVTPEIIDLL